MQEEHSYPKPPFNTNYMQYGFEITHYSFWRELDVEEDV